jgi:hypothetical protein
MLHIGPRRGEAQTVERGVVIVDGTQRRFEFALAAVIERFADTEDGSPIANGLLAQQVDGEAKAVEDGRSTVACLQIRHHLRDVIQVARSVSNTSSLK